MILSVQPLLSEIKKSIHNTIVDLPKPPKLSVILVGENPGSLSYVKAKKQLAEEIGIHFDLIHLAENIPEHELLQYITIKNTDTTIDGILVQLPLPSHICSKKITAAIPANKDVDGFSKEGIMAVFQWDISALIPCTPKGIIRLIEWFNRQISGAEIVIVGNGNLVGKPLWPLLWNLGATVTICNKSTRDLASHTRRADILIVAAGVPGLIRASMVKPNALVIDVGVNRINGKLCGDCMTEEIGKIADITPVPGGVGPMTVMMLMENTIIAATKNR